MAHESKKWSLKFGFPTNIELGLVVLAGIFLIILDASQNIGQNNISNSFSVMTWWGLSAIVSWWIFFALYNLTLFVVYGRALRSRKTSYKYDTIFAILAFIGLLFLLGAGIFAFYASADTPIPYFMNIGQITIYHGGIACQWIALLYFIITS